jgi:peptide methionine sulfoxide reductase MsrA
MTATYEKIATNTISGSSTSQVTFSSISGSYTDIVIVFNGGSVSGPVDLVMQVNSDTGSNYSSTDMYGANSAASSRLSNRTQFNCNRSAYLDSNLNQNQIIQLMNYSNATTYKTFLSRANNAAVGTDATVGLWRNTAAITAVKLFVIGDNFRNASTLTLYGIKAE